MGVVPNMLKYHSTRSKALQKWRMTCEPGYISYWFGGRGWSINYGCTTSPLVRYSAFTTWNDSKCGSVRCKPSSQQKLVMSFNELYEYFCEFNKIFLPKAYEILKAWYPPRPFTVQVTGNRNHLDWWKIISKWQMNFKFTYRWEDQWVLVLVALRLR